VYRCPSGNLLPYHYSNVENGMTLRRYWSTAACQACAVKSQCTPSKERRMVELVGEDEAKFLLVDYLHIGGGKALVT
jgi:hypothetical protein